MIMFSTLITKLNWANYFQTTFNSFVPNWVVFIVNALLFFLFIKLFYWIFKNVILLFTKKTKTKLDDAIISALEKPLLWSLFVLFMLLEVGLLSPSKTINNIIFRLGISLIIIFATWFLYKLIGILHEHILMPIAKKTESAIDDQLFPIVRKTARVVLIIFSIIYILNWFGIDIAPLLTGVGISGLALAFAAQKTLGNVFGGITIFLDKPFQVGDVINVNNITGTVLEVGLRSTRVKTFEGTIVTIPNEDIASASVENVSERKARKVKMQLGLVYDTSTKKLKEAKKIIQKILEKNPHVDENFSIFFSEFGDSALIINITYWITELYYSEYIKAKDDINTQIKEEFEKAKIDMAYPTQTILLKK